MDQQVYSIIEKYYRNECSPEEVRLLLSHFNTDSDEELLSYIMKGFELERKGFAYDGVDKEALDADKRALDSVYVKLEEQIRQTGTLIEKQRKLWPRILRITGVAAAVAAIVFGIWFFSAQYMDSRHPEFISGSQYDISPGSNKATLTLANGEVINLSDAKTGVVIGDNDLKYNDGTAVANLSPSGRDGVAREGNNNNNPLSPQGGSLPGGERSKVQTLTASTPRGGTYQVTLPDGTRAWLNADSKISFPTQFSGKERKILLINGEAYFEVAKLTRLSPPGRDGRRPERVPFIVESNGQQVEVLGTHFNISAYKDEASTKTTLLEGSVRVAFLSPSASRSSLPRGEMALAREGSKNNKPSLSGGHLSQGERGANSQSIVLKPNQQAILLSPSGRDGVARAGKIKVTQVDANEAIAWKNGKFAFENEEIGVIMKKVERWYNVQVIYQDKMENVKVTGSVSRYEEVSQLLNMLETTGGIHFKIEGKKIIISK